LNRHRTQSDQIHYGTCYFLDVNPQKAGDNVLTSKFWIAAINKCFLSILSRSTVLGYGFTLPQKLFNCTCFVVQHFGCHRPFIHMCIRIVAPLTAHQQFMLSHLWISVCYQFLLGICERWSMTMFHENDYGPLTLKTISPKLNVQVENPTTIKQAW